MFLRVTAVLAVSGGLAFAMLYPMFWAEQDRQPAGDATVMVWNQWHNTESVLNGKSPLYTDSWLWPNGANLGKHTLSPGFFPVGVVVKMVTGGDPLWPFYAFRIIVFGSFVLLFSLMYWFLRELSCRPLSSIVIASAFTYSDFFMGHAVYPQFSAMAFYPLVSVLLLRLWKEPSPKKLLLLATSIAISVYFTEMVIFWVMGVLMISFLYSTLPRGREDIRRIANQISLLGWLVSAGVALLVAGPFLIAFSKVEEVSLAATAEVFSADLVDFFVPGQKFSPLWVEFLNRILSFEYEGREMVFLGYVIPLLVILSFGLTTKKHQAIIRCILVTAIIFLLLSLGPNLAPYHYLAKIPPFTTFRAPMRLTVVALFLLSIPAALTLSRISQIKGGIGRLGAVFFCLLAITEIYVSHSSIRRGDFSGNSLYKVFATPSRDFAKLVVDKGVPGPWVTLPPKFQDDSGVLAQIFHQQPIFATCWMSRWPEDQKDDFCNLSEVYKNSFPFRDSQDPELLASWLKSQGVRNVLLVRAGSLNRQSVEKLSESINVVDARKFFTINPFVDIFSPEMVAKISALELELD